MEEVGDVGEEHLHERWGRRFEEFVATGGGGETEGDVGCEKEGSVFEGCEDEFVEDWIVGRR